MRSFLCIFMSASLAWADISVTTRGFDNPRSGANTRESIINPGNVALMANLGTYAVDGAVWAQPLVAAGIGGRTLVIVATENSSIYAFDAAAPGSTYLWRQHVTTPWTFTPTPGSTSIYPNGQIGCMPTPVLDMGLSVVFAACMNADRTWRLYSLNLADGSTYHAPIVIAATDTISGIAFDQNVMVERAALLLFNETVYVSFGSDWAEHVTYPYNGWVMGYNTSTLAQSYKWCATCSQGILGQGGVWMGGGGLAANDTSVFTALGNGLWDGITAFGQSIVKLGASLTVDDWYTPTNHAAESAADADLGQNRVILIGATHLVQVQKSGRVWVLDQANMGHLQSSGVGPVQTWDLSGDLWADAYVYANGAMYIASQSATVQRYAWLGAAFNLTAISASSGTARGGAMSYSSNGATNGIVWVTSCATSAGQALVNGTLRAIRTDTMTEAWNSGVYGLLAKWNPPTVANGRVYVPTNNSVVVFGNPLPTWMYLL